MHNFLKGDDHTITRIQQWLVTIKASLIVYRGKNSDSVTHFAVYFQIQGRLAPSKHSHQDQRSFTLNPKLVNLVRIYSMYTVFKDR